MNTVQLNKDILKDSTHRNTTVHSLYEDSHTFYRNTTRPHPPCFLSLHETKRRRRRRRLLLFTDRLPFLESKIQTDRSQCCLLFYVPFDLFLLCLSATWCSLPAVSLAFVLHTGSEVGGVWDAGSLVSLVVKFSF